MVRNQWAEKRQTRALYDASAEAHDAAYESEQAAKQQAALLMIRLGSDSLALDIGCGSGRFLTWIAGQVKLAVGVDISRIQLGLAMRGGSRKQNLSLICCDAENLPFVSSAFETIFILTVLQNLPSPARCLHEARRALRQDGNLVLSFLKKSFTKPEIEKLLATTQLHPVTWDENAELRDYVLACRPT